jgi:hypothetical protein
VFSNVKSSRRVPYWLPKLKNHRAKSGGDCQSFHP